MASSDTKSTTFSDSNSDFSDNDTAIMDSDNETAYAELTCKLELLQRNCTSPNNKMLNLTYITRFREIMGTALAQIRSC